MAKKDPAQDLEERRRQQLIQEAEAHHNDMLFLCTEQFQSRTISEMVCVDIAEEIITKACDRYIVSAYDKLAYQYTAEALWDEVTALIATTRVIADKHPSPEEASKNFAASMFVATNGNAHISPPNPSFSMPGGMALDDAPRSPGAAPPPLEMDREESSLAGVRTSRQGNESPTTSLHSGGTGTQQVRVDDSPAQPALRRGGARRPSQTTIETPKGNLNPPQSPVNNAQSSSTARPGGKAAPGGFFARSGRRRTIDSILSDGGLPQSGGKGARNTSPLPGQPTSTTPALVAPTWDADDEPAMISCDIGTRHAIVLRSKPKPKEAPKQNESGSRRPGMGRPRPSNLAASGLGGTTSGSTLRVSSASGAGGGASDVSSSRPTSAVGSDVSRSTANGPRKPGGKTSKRPHGKPASNAPPSPRLDASPAAQEPPTQMKPEPSASNVEPSLSPEDVALLAAIENESKRRQRSVDVQRALTQQLADKSLEKGFVVDSRSGKVIPITAPEEALASAKKLIEPLKFNVPTKPEGAEEETPPPASKPPNTAPVGHRPAPKPKHRGRREDQYYAAEGSVVPMVTDLKPVGGVGVKDDGAPRREELKVQKMTRAEYTNLVKVQAVAGDDLDREVGPQGGVVKDSTIPRAPADPLDAAVAQATTKKDGSQKKEEAASPAKGGLKKANDGSTANKATPQTARMGNRQNGETKNDVGGVNLPLTARAQTAATGSKPETLGMGGGIRVPEGLGRKRHITSPVPKQDALLHSSPNRRLLAAQLVQDRQSKSPSRHGEGIFRHEGGVSLEEDL